MNDLQLYVMGAHEIRLRLGRLSRQRVHQLTCRDDFPAPAAVLAQGKIWFAGEVERWIAIHRPEQ